MSLINCRDCGAEISKSASLCMKCGCTLLSSNLKIVPKFGGADVFWIIFWLFVIPLLF